MKRDKTKAATRHSPSGAKKLPKSGEDWIDQKLIETYQEVLDEEIPRELVEAVRKLGKAQRRR